MLMSIILMNNAPGACFLYAQLQRAVCISDMVLEPFDFNLEYSSRLFMVQYMAKEHMVLGHKSRSKSQKSSQSHLNKFQLFPSICVDMVLPLCKSQIMSSRTLVFLNRNATKIIGRKFSFLFKLTKH